MPAKPSTRTQELTHVCCDRAEVDLQIIHVTSLHRKREVANTEFCWPGKRVLGETVRRISAVVDMDINVYTLSVQPSAAAAKIGYGYMRFLVSVCYILTAHEKEYFPFTSSAIPSPSQWPERCS